MKTLATIILGILLAASIAGAQELDHSTSVIDDPNEVFEVGYDQQVYATMRYFCFACSDFHKLEYIECECPLDRSYPPKCDVRHFASYCNRTGIIYVLDNPLTTHSQFEKRDIIRNMKAYELSGFAHSGVLEYNVTKELPPITDWTLLDREIRKSQEIADALFDEAWSIRVVPR